MANSVTGGATNNAEIDGVLSGYKWSGTITYSFPDSPSDYANPYSGGSSEPTQAGFATAPSQMQAAINYAIGLILSYTNADIRYAGTNGADIMIAQSPAANPTSYAYYPGNYASGGDIWFGTKYNYSQAQLGNYYFTTALHELGHAFGLKHSQETGGPANIAVPSAHDDSEYTVMSYRSYVGASTTSGYTNEAYGYPQTYMANDILALQTMYGADYTTQNSNTIYTWSPTTGQEFINGVGQLAPGGGAGGSANRIYETVWDGGGVDTYDLSNYTTNLSINLNPGAASVFSAVQLANLGDGHYASGNVYNAYLYNGDARSYIDNATGGFGNDTIIGNIIANVLNGGAGNDTITGGGGNDTIIGGAGADTVVYSGSELSYGITYSSSTQTFTISDLRSGSPDGNDTVTGVEQFQFADGTISSAALVDQITPITIEAIGATSLVQVGGHYSLNPVGAPAGPLLKVGGLAVTVGQFGLSPIGAEQVAGGGYDLAWKAAGADQYAVWSVDSSGNFVSNLTPGGVAGGSTSLESFETAFQQDLNGDGFIGVPPTIVIEAIGATSLVQVGGQYLLNPVGGAAGPSLKIGGAAVTAGQFGLSPIGAEQVAGGGYDLAWKAAGADQYAVWSVDSSGNFVSNLTPGGVAGGSTSLESFETAFQQDLNGDGFIGFPPTIVIEAIGATSLVQVGGQYLLNPVGGGAGPSLKIGGAAVTAGQFGLSLIGAEQVAGSGYGVAWKAAGADQYAVWSVDSSGEFISNLTPGGVAGSSAALGSFETIFHQDLNGDGIVGFPSQTVQIVIEAFGATSLVQDGSIYLLNPVGGGSGPSLKIGGSAVTSTQFGLLPIGAEQLAGGGYDVAWKAVGVDQYAVWSVDNNGNFISNLTPGGMAGNSAALKSFETTFHQDLSGDGAISMLPASTSTTAFTEGENGASGFVFRPKSGTNNAPAQNTGPAELTLGTTLPSEFGWILDSAPSEHLPATAHEPLNLGIEMIAGHFDHFFFH
ncbi:M10 family metallopeptidase C-terminal domain-containing protein [Bradyrhizobium sp. CB2312]|uniref:M10 family metallopeptidase C-terminal domain-containing protein n=1 Tax=Bradyrhizobium sp. CB2312 TaxID=3039155 RepID=UPI0024B0C531|nr:M10 family metallopeptidase C-terminal domain-containing protein [Bradyrhizobium sp. CB2312]WFU75660.1 M10 family metallopeptidase C-terminal domain-containing protein [Bradyrhizobium sp. CB2312]